MGDVAILDAVSVLGAVSAAEAVERTERAFIRHAAGDWRMPAKTYVDAPPDGDFRAMPATGDGLATLKWVTSFPGNPERGLPVVAGALLVSDAATGALRAICDCAAVTALRTGAAAAVSAGALARSEASTAAVVGCGVNGAWAARCLRAAGYARGVCADVRFEAAEELAGELGWEATTVTEALGAEVVVTVTPGDVPVVTVAGLRPGQHFAVLGADAAGKAEVEAAVFERCSIFCDEWEQASKGGELAGPVARGELSRDGVRELGAVLTGMAPGRASEEEITLFDSTGLAIQDLGIAQALVEALDRGSLDVPRVDL